MALEKFVAGTTVVIRIVYHNPFTKELEDPESANITIRDEVTKTKVVDNVIMEDMETGTYEYYFTSEDDATPGKYVATITAVFNSRPVKDKIHFILEAEE